jgi:uncharacterized protein (TIGR03435 family)
MKRILFTLTIGFAAVFAVQATPQKSFEVASVKPNVSGDGPSDPRMSPERFSWTNVTLRQLVQVAYNVRPYQLIGLPAWADTARFDVSATTGVAVSPQQMYSMLQSLLADRFDMATHREQRQLPAYSLVVARPGSKLGKGIQPSTKDCESMGATPLNSTTAQSEYDGCTPQMGLARLKVSGVRISFLASGLTRILERPVIDKTSLSGTFDMELSWTPDPTMMPNGVTSPPNVPPGGPSIFTALEEQLGLKIVSDRAPVDVLVVDRLKSLKLD